MSRAAWRRFRSVLLYPGVAALTLLFGLAPWRLSQKIGSSLGAWAFRAVPRDRQRALEHLAIAFPEASAQELSRLARESFRNLGMNLAECLHLLLRGSAAVAGRIEVDGWQNVERARASGRGILILTGHCGNWEILGVPITRGGVHVAAVARGMDEGLLQRVLIRIRQRIGTETIARGQPGSTRKLLQTIRQRDALAMLIDQDTRVDGTFVPFFGRPAFTPTGAAELALKRDIAVIPTFIERQPDGRHHATFHPELELPQDATQATAAMTRTIEQQIRRVPEQWVWLHRRWRTQPPDQ